ncbi:MAG: rhamnogalacturonan acetylesterase [Nibricoccus sp.]
MNFFKKLFVVISLAAAASSHAATIYLIGDSTVCNYSSTYYPRTGWGQVFGSSFKTTITISNKALSGRSSKSFYDEGAWTPVKNALKSGDYVFIQFGHNDEKSDDPTRYTDPYTTYQQYLTIYINDARAKGAIPILVTPVERNSWSNGVVKATHGNYPAAMRALASAKGTPLIDLTAGSTSKYNSQGQTYTTWSIFMNLKAGQYSNYPNGNTDNTHFQLNGANIIASLVVGAVRSSSNAQLKVLATYLK